MNYWKTGGLIIIFAAALQIACGSTAPQTDSDQIKAERKPFQKSPYVIKQPRKPTHDELEAEGISDPKSRVVVVDEKAGKYEFRWKGYDGKLKVVAYQRHDAIDGFVEARAEKTDSGKFRYEYVIEVSRSSPSRLLNFVLYTMTSVAQPIHRDDVQAGPRYPLLLVDDGFLWFSYFPMEEKGLIVNPGDKFTIYLESTSPQGLIRFWVSGGELATKGVGEDLPGELEREIPIFQDLANGYTIGPVEKLSGMSKPERAEYLLECLPRFQEAGWMSEGTAKNYEAILKREDLSGALVKAKKDLENEFITNEVFQIIEGLAR